MVAFFDPPEAGSIIEPASVVQFDLAANGYLEREFLVSGTASAYALNGPESADGNWSAEASGVTAPYRTRIVVRRPADPARFSGTLLVEWLNVSSGFDADPDWTYQHEEIVRAGHAWVGVSAQALGVTGGTGLISFAGVEFPGLRGSDGARYGTLEHPGDQFAFELFSQIGRALKGDAASLNVLGGLTPERILAIGESQSAFYLTSYINAVHPVEPVFDGFLVHSRGANAAPLSGAGLDREAKLAGVRIRSDIAAPVLVLESEGDTLPPLGFGLARQPDTDRFRLWEVAGTAHADAYLIGAAAELLGCDWRINEGPHRFVAQAAVRALDGWVRDGTPPPRAARVELASDHPLVIARDELGIAIGGVRTPAVDAPVVVLSGEAPPGANAQGWLVGSTTPIDDATLVRLYGNKAGYLDNFTKSLDAAIETGFLLPEHRAHLLAEAAAVTFPHSD